jgi:hypothetical protein
MVTRNTVWGMQVFVNQIAQHSLVEFIKLKQCSLLIGKSINQSFTFFGLSVSVISSRDHFMLVRDYVNVERNVNRESFMSYSL